MKRAVFVVTDGFPVGDTVAPQTVIERANAADVSVFVVTLPSYSRMMAIVGTNTIADAARRQWFGRIDWRSKCLRERERLCDRCFAHSRRKSAPHTCWRFIRLKKRGEMVKYTRSESRDRVA